MQQEEFIPGIFNYCDRWCEKCKLAARCKLYAKELEQLKSVDGEKGFFEIVSKNLNETIQLLHEIALERGIDLDAIEADEDEVEKEQAEFDEALAHPLCVAAEKYSKETDEWLKECNYLEQEKTVCLQQIEMGISPEKQEKNLLIVEEVLSIVSWYQFQIPVKLSSAVRYFPHDPDFEDEIQNMHHAAAKIALIGIENSMKAWHTLLEIAHENREDMILNFLLQLEILKKNILKKFPLIHQFKRPGFDD